MKVLSLIHTKFIEILIYFLIIFSPWAFGTTEKWSIWVMICCSYLLGLVTISNIIIYRLENNWKCSNPEANRTFNFLLIILAIFMFFLLLFIIISAANARGYFDLITYNYQYYDNYNKDLPHSYNSSATWLIFWQYSALILQFWAVKEWIDNSPFAGKKLKINLRFKKLMYTICFNGGFIALVSILQRFYYEGTDGKLLFTISPNINTRNIDQFGPFAYRSNASTYLNLIWPLCIGLYISVGQKNIDLKHKRLGEGNEFILIPCIILAASGPIICSARGGTFIMATLAIICALVIFFSDLKSKALRLSVLLFILISIAMAYKYGWVTILDRFETMITDNLGGRKIIYEVTLEMIDDYGAFGSGPGTFETVIMFELGNKIKTWESWAHNDYLEFYLTFGKYGATILLIILFIFIFLFFIHYKSLKYRIFAKLYLVALIGVFAHALFDFPFQVYSILSIISITSGAIISKLEDNNIS